MYAQGVTESDVISWARKALDKSDLTDYQISVVGSTEKGDGYVGDIVFITANGITRKNNKGVLNLVIKHAKSSEHLRQIAPIKSTFETEIQMYGKVFPEFKKFQLEKNVVDGFDSVPKCYLTLILDQMEVLVMENLKSNGYELHDRKKAMNFDHVQLVLKEYGRLHALSFALKDQNVEEFNNISEFGSCAWIPFWTDKSFRENFNNGVAYAISVLRDKGHETLCKKFEDLLVKEASDIMLDLLNEREEQSVIGHGDSWNNNFMFQYEDNKNSPSNVKILDWQLSSLRSPAIDLSYFIYANSSQKELDRFDELIGSYYTSFSDFLIKLGSDPEQLFTFEDLRRHWRKYGMFGFLLMSMGLRFPLCEKEDAPVTEEIQELGNLIDIKITDVEEYYKRLQAITTHYFEHKF